MGFLTANLNTGANDGLWKPSTVVFNNVHPEAIAWAFEHPDFVAEFPSFTDGERSYAYMRFPSVAISQGEEIVSALVNIRSEYTTPTGGGDFFIVHGWDVDDADPITSFSEAQSAYASRTSASSGILDPAWTYLDDFQIDVTSIVQALVNRAGWTSGNALVLLFTIRPGETEGDGVGRYASSYESGFGATLDITYGNFYDETGSGGARTGGSATVSKITSIPSRTTGPPWYAYSFDGVDDAFILNTGSSFSLNADSFSFQMWFKGTWQSEKCLFGSLGVYFTVRTTNITNQIELAYNSDDGDNHISKSTIAGLFDNTWRHLVITEVVGTGQPIYYLDAVPQTVDSSIGTAIGNIFFGNFSSARPTIMCGNTGGMHVLHKAGEATEVALWSSTLSQASVTALYNNGDSASASGIGSNLMGYWSMRNTLEDSSAGNNDLTALGAPSLTELPGAEIEEPAAGIDAAGTSDSFIGKVASGGARTAGSAVVMKSVNDFGDGGVLVNGSGIMFTAVPVSGMGGVVTSGTAFSYVGLFIIYDDIAEGGIVSAGLSESEIDIPGSGSLLLAGSALLEVIADREVTGGVVAGGESLLNIVPTIEPTGGILAAGTASYYVFDAIYEGVINIGGSAEYYVNSDTSFVWNVDEIIESDFQFVWNTGEERVYWYRIIGEAREDQCDPIQIGDACCRQYVVNIHARSITELCDKLRSRRWKWPIASVKRWSRPAFNADVEEDEANGIDHDCNVLEEVEICGNLLCSEFCLDGDVEESWGFSMTARTVMGYVASGGVTISDGSPYFDSYEASGTVDIEGSADFTESYRYAASGGVDMDGSSDFTLYDADGNILMGVLDLFDVSFSETIEKLQIEFVEETLDTTETDTDLVSKCGCSGMSLLMPFSQNLATSNKLSQFFVRNNLSFDRIQQLRYSERDDSWSANFQWTGFSAESPNRESWRTIFRLNCSNSIGGQTIDYRVWTWSMQVVQRNLTTSADFDTRFVVAFLPDTVCANGFQARINLNVRTGTVSFRPDTEVYYSVLHDNIGLFSNSYWTKNPVLSFDISQIGLEAVIPRYPLVLNE